MSAFAKLYTGNATAHVVWVTIYDLGKTTHLDYGWLESYEVREWTSGNYAWGSFYYVRAEVKASSHDSANIFDTTVQVNPQNADALFAASIDLVTLGGVEAGPVSRWSQEMNGTGNVVYLKGDVAGNYWWEHYN